MAQGRARRRFSLCLNAASRGKVRKVYQTLFPSGQTPAPQSIVADFKKYLESVGQGKCKVAKADGSGSEDKIVDYLLIGSQVPDNVWTPLTTRFPKAVVLDYNLNDRTIKPKGGSATPKVAESDEIKVLTRSLSRLDISGEIQKEAPPSPAANASSSASTVVTPSSSPIPASSQSFASPSKYKPMIFSNRFTPSERFEVGLSQTLSARSYQEDQLVALGSFNGISHLDFFGVYDGHGGSEVSAYVSEELHGYLDPKLKPNENWSDVFEAVYAKTHKGCLKKKGGSCALNVYINTNVIITANVGDSRAILVTSTGVERLSTDHKPTDEGEKKRVEEKGGNVEYDSNGKCYRIQPAGITVSRSLGDQPATLVGVIQKPSVSVRQLDASSLCLVLASDGIWDVMKDNEVAAVVKKKAFAGASEVARYIMRDAVYRGSGDNCSVLVVFLRDSASW